MKVGSLFSGIGGLDLGLEQAGMQTIWQVEYDDWCREKLQENFPHTEKFKDVREVGKYNLREVDLICGGFPCQDLSIANTKREGLDGKRSGLWTEYYRIICELRPRYVLIENVAALLVRGLDRVLSDLASIGFDAEWQVLRASSFGLPHQRRRLFIIAYPNRFGLETCVFQKGFNKNDIRWSPSVAAVSLSDIGRSFVEIPEHLRVDNGLSVRVSELKPIVKGYGNAVVPPVAKWLGEQILRFDKEINFQ